MFTIFIFALGIAVGTYQKQIREWFGGLLMDLEREDN